jgi:hypothetical protein
LNCPIPNKPPGETIRLEECLADYFTNIVEVRRQLERSVSNENTSSNYSSSHPSSSSDAPPSYTGSGHGFYGVDEKAALKKGFSTQERNVRAWQVSEHVLAMLM